MSAQKHSPIIFTPPQRQSWCCRDDAQTCEWAICSRNRCRCVWWKTIRVSLFYSCLWAVKRKIEYPRGKLTLLIKYITGEVKEMVKNCVQLPPKEGYETVKQMMNKLYGDPHRVIAAYCKEIKQWPQIKLESFTTSYLNVRILHKCKHGMFLALLKLCACYWLNFHVELETSG